MLKTNIYIPPEWDNAASQILASGGPVVVIGSPGSGKSTFCRYLADYYSLRNRRVVWIDGDPGQPSFGPPAALSLTYHTSSEGPGRMLALAFIGDTSPVGHLLEVVTGLQKLHSQTGRVEHDLALINTCGLVDGGAARELAFHEIDILSPRFIVALQRTNEVEHLLFPHAHHSGLLTLRLPASPDAYTPSREARQALREQHFKDYFRGAEFQELALSDLGVHGPGICTGDRLGFRDINKLSNILKAIIVHAEHAADRLFLITDGGYAEETLLAAKEQYGVREIIIIKRSELDHLLVGLNNDQNLCLGLGVLCDIDFREMTIRVITPLRDVTPVRHLSLGSLKVNPAGRELGRL